MLERPARLSGPTGDATQDTLLRVLLTAILGIILFASINAVKIGVAGVPLRALLAPVAIGVALLLRPMLLVETVVQLRRPLIVVLAFMMLGIVVSVAARNPVAGLLAQVVEVHVQAIFGLCIAGMLARLAGVRTLVILFLGAFAVSAFVTVLQFAHVDLGWQLRAIVGRISRDPPITQDFYIRRYRALGMAYNPVILGTQACLAFAAYFGYRLWATAGEATRKLDWPLLLVWLACAFVCVASGNRSPLLGFLLFFAAYSALVAPRTLLVIGPLLVIALLAAGGLLQYLETLGLRVANTSNSSAEGRATLAAYGWALVKDNPAGYGLTFNSILYAPHYTDVVLHMENPNVIRAYTLHNYFMLMLTKYGIGAILFAPLALPLHRSGWWATLGFLPYLAHIAFHNEGPLQSDVLIWYVLPIFFPAIAALEALRPVDRRQLPGGWRRDRRLSSAA